MRIAFATTQSAAGSTIVGRILPLAMNFAARGHEVHLLLLYPATLPPAAGVAFALVGREPFVRTPSGKKRQRGLPLLLTTVRAVLGTAARLAVIRPDVVVISKPLPVNVTGVWLYRLFRKVKVVLDADDFELTANVLTSLWQRAAIHAAERLALRFVSRIVVATPFLIDHFQGLGRDRSDMALIVTGYTAPPTPSAAPRGEPTMLYLGSLSLSSGHRVDLLPEMLEVVRQSFPNVKLIIAGEGDDRSVLYRAFNQRNLLDQVEWVGRFDAQAVPHLVGQSQVMIDPVDTSITARAKSSFRVALALAYGRSVITSNVGIRAELIPLKLQAACFALAGDARAYGRAAAAQLARPLSPSQADALRNAARRYTWEKLAHDYLALL